MSWATVFTTSVIAASGALAQPPGKAELLSQLAAARSSLRSLDVTCRIHRAFAISPDATTPERWRLAWRPGQLLTEAAGELANQQLVGTITRAIDGESGGGLVYPHNDVAQVGTDPEALGLRSASREYWAFMGYFPIASLTGDTPLLNDVEQLLKEPTATVAPTLETIRGHACVVVELPGQRTDGSTFVQWRGHYAPDLGYAQVRFELLAPDGSPRSRWESTEFLEVGDGLTAIPLAGEFSQWEGRDQAVRTGVVSMEVLVGADGAPLVASGETVDYEVDLPAGTELFDWDTGTLTTLGAPTSFPALLADARTSDDQALRPAMYAALSVLAALCGVAAFRRRGLRR
jgi:hypothetical protein